MSRLPLALLLTGLGAALTGCPNPTTIDLPRPPTAGPTCSDGIRNGSETDVDCGGTCDTCDIGDGCITGADCADGTCLSGACQEATCADGVDNGDETDIDCGGSCGACETGDSCATPADCQQGVCESDECQPAQCDDAVTNGLEVDLDCGGPDCTGCDRGSVCVEDDDCADSVCFSGTCERVLFVRGTGATADASVEQFPDQDLLRIDFASPPMVTDYDGATVELPISPGTFVAAGISPTLSVTTTVAGTSIMGATGSLSYQSITPDYFGVLIGMDSPDSTTAAYDTLIAQSLDGSPIEIVVLDITP